MVLWEHPEVMLVTVNDERGHWAAEGLGARRSRLPRAAPLTAGRGRRGWDGADSCACTTLPSAAVVSGVRVRVCTAVCMRGPGAGARVPRVGCVKLGWGGPAASHG